MRRDIAYNAPVLAYDYPPDGEPIWPCYDCLPWHVEVVFDPEDGAVLVREWHAIGCEVFTKREEN